MDFQEIYGRKTENNEKQDNQSSEFPAKITNFSRNIRYDHSMYNHIDKKIKIGYKEEDGHEMLYESSELLRQSHQLWDAFSAHPVFREGIAPYRDRREVEQKAIEKNHADIMRSLEDFVCSPDKNFEPIDRGFQQLDGSLSKHKETLQEIADKIKQRLKDIVPTQSFDLSYKDLDGTQKLARSLFDKLFDPHIAPDAGWKIAWMLGQLQEKAVVGRLIWARFHPNVDQSIRGDITRALGRLLW
jgi:hypothetical protein